MKSRQILQRPDRRRATATLVAGGALAAGLVTVRRAQAQAREVVKIGYSGPLSGGAALYGKNCLDGMLMAAAEVNAAGLEIGGKPYTLEIVPLDDKYNPSETAINARRLVQEHKTPAILCPHSGGSLAMQTTNEQQKVLLLSYTSVPQVVARGNSLTVRLPPEFTSYIPAFIQHAMTHFGKNVGIASADHDYGKAWVAAFKPAWEKAGGKIASENLMSYNRSTDFYSGVSRALSSKPEVLFIGGASEPTGLVVKQARELGFKGGFMIIDQAKMDEISRVIGGYDALEGAIGVLPLIEDKSESARAFVERFRKLYPDRFPSSEVSFNYAAVHATVTAMKLAGTATDAAAIRARMGKAFESMSTEYNPNTTTGVLDNGATTAKMRVAVVEKGQIREVTIGGNGAS